MDSTVFVGAVIAGVTEALRRRFPQVSGEFTVLVAALIGGLIAVVDVWIGLPDQTVWQGIATGLGTAGVAGVVKKIG